MYAARAAEKAFADAKKSLPINVDGAIGAILADLGMNPAAFNGIFMIARTPGLIAHVIEEQTRERPMRRIDPVNHGYDGPPPRSLPARKLYNFIRCPVSTCHPERSRGIWTRQVSFCRLAVSNGRHSTQKLFIFRGALIENRRFK